MFILIFFIVMSISQFITNTVVGIDDTVEDSYNYSKKDSLSIGILLLVGVIFEIVTNLKFDAIVSLVNKFYWILVAVYAVAALLIMVILSEARKTEIAKKRADLEQVYEILIPIVDKGGKNGLDYNNPPFRLSYKYGDIQKIEVDIDPVTFKGDDKTLVAVVSQLDTFLTTFKWTYDTSRTSERLLEFIGENKPPQMARWPGSWLRNFRFMPTGISGKGEIGFTADDVPKDLTGRSLYLNENGEYIPQDTTLPKQPQALVAGAPLGLNTIIPTTKGYKTMETIEIGDEVFDINNKPVKVLGKSKVNYNPDKVYRLTFKNEESKISIISDSIHKFPIWKSMRVNRPQDSGIIVTAVRERVEVTAENLKVNDNIVANNKEYYTLIKKEEVEKQSVQCILVDSDEHLFLITDESHIYEEWKGGNSYPYEAVYTRNTGGGKSVYIQNVILHCLEHRDKIAVALVDPKQVEFSTYNGMNGVLGVATSTLEAAEILRIGRQVMYKRNKELQKLGLKNVAEYKPHEKSGKVFITGREIDENEQVKVRINGEEKTMTAAELAEYLHSEE